MHYCTARLINLLFYIVTLVTTIDVPLFHQSFSNCVATIRLTNVKQGKTHLYVHSIDTTKQKTKRQISAGSTKTLKNFNPKIDNIRPQSLL